MASYPLISIDTEFPGVIIHSNPNFRQQPEYNYAIMRANVESMHLIQLGLTLSDHKGNLPNFGTSNSFIWEFNFCEFDVHHDLHAPDSIALLCRQGIDFEKNRKFGVDTASFANLMMSSGLLFNRHNSWITFHGAYDFGYLVKALTQSALPRDIRHFLWLVEALFGVRVYDAKHLMNFCPNLYGGLDRVSESLKLERVVGNSHQASSDSLLTCHLFQKMKETYFEKESDDSMIKYASVLYGLEVQVC